MMNGLRINLIVDKDNQWFARIWVVLGKRKEVVYFKIDTGCNAVVLSHDTLKRLGFATGSKALSNLPNITGTQVSGDKQVFKKLGTISLYRDREQSVHICDTQAICHAVHETNDLIGTEALRQFCGVNFNLTDKKYMELIK
ncbi:MAG: hypothetical protein FWC89_14370 [Defluviitaleaceae bacterium]|nr:hypothetical protein [Defluviitaleaceae bacterium]